MLPQSRRQSQRQIGRMVREEIAFECIRRLGRAMRRDAILFHLRHSFEHWEPQERERIADVVFRKMGFPG